MFRSGAPRAAFRTLNSISAASGRTSFGASLNTAQFSSRLCTMTKGRPTTVRQPLAMAFARTQSRGAMDNINPKLEQKIGAKPLEAHPETVSSTSSTHALFEEVGTKEPEKDADMMAGVRSDLVCIVIEQAPSPPIDSVRKLSRKPFLSTACRGRHTLLAWPVSCLTSQLPSPPSSAPTRSTTHTTTEVVSS